MANQEINSDSNSMKVNFNAIGRITFASNPTAAINLQRLYTPLLTDFKHIPIVWSLIEQTFPEMETNDQKILFVAVAYKLYSPGSLLPEKAVNAPAGLRAAMAKHLKYRNGSNINSWLSFARVYIKNDRYCKRINKIINDFQVLDN